MFDFAYEDLKRKILAQTVGEFDVCQGCVFQKDKKCSYQGGMGIQLPIGCPKRPDAQKTAGLYAVCADCLHLKEGECLLTGERRQEKEEACIDFVEDPMLEEQREDKKIAQVFAPGPGPWEQSVADGVTLEEVVVSSPARGEAGPFGNPSPTPARGDIRVLVPRAAPRVLMSLVAQTSSPADTGAGQTQPTSGQDTGQTECLFCGNPIPKGGDKCPKCGQPLSDLTRMQAVAQYPLCYFCHQPVSGLDKFVLVLDGKKKVRKGVAHLVCAQQAEQNLQGEFDKDYDFVLFVEEEEGEKEKWEEGEAVSLLEEWEDLSIGEKGRLALPGEIEEAGLAPRLSPFEKYVIFDHNPKKLYLVPTDKFEKISSRRQPCPKGYVAEVLIVQDHCVLATDDPDDIFACRDKSCQYHQPVSLEQWRQLLQKDVPGSFGYTPPFSYEVLQEEDKKGFWNWLRKNIQPFGFRIS